MVHCLPLFGGLADRTEGDRHLATLVDFPTQRIRVKTSQELQAEARWNELENQLNDWFHEPDTEALRLALAVAVSHYFKSDDPVWLMILGPPGTGKTSVTITALSALEEAQMLDDLTPTTLLSGYKKGNSFLHQIGTPEDRSAIILMPDFGTFTSKRDEIKKEIAGQLRRVYDGEFDRATGAGQKLEWEGKVTLIVAATPAAERSWAVMRDLGERFMQVRWPRGDGVSQALQAHRQIGREKDIKRGVKDLTRKLVDTNTLTPVMTPPEVVASGVVNLAEMIALLRGHVVREVGYKRDIVDVPQPEGPTRIMKSLAQVARGHATIFRRQEVTGQDFKIARRLALDSIPPVRKAILDEMIRSGEIGWASLVRATELPPSTISRNCEELEALGVLLVDENKVEKSYRLTDSFAELVTKAAPILNQ